MKVAHDTSSLSCGRAAERLGHGSPDADRKSQKLFSCTYVRSLFSGCLATTNYTIYGCVAASNRRQMLETSTASAHRAVQLDTQALRTPTSGRVVRVAEIAKTVYTRVTLK